MKQILLALMLLLLNLPVYAIDHGAIFEIKPITEIKDGKMTTSSGSYKQIYKLKDGQIYKIYSENLKHSDYTLADEDHFTTTLIPTLTKQDYYYGTFSSGLSNAVITIDKNFNALTIFQFNGLDTHCTVWYGKAVKKF